MGGRYIHMKILCFITCLIVLKDTLSNTHMTYTSLHSSAATMTDAASALQSLKSLNAYVTTLKTHSQLKSHVHITNHPGETQTGSAQRDTVDSNFSTLYSSWYFSY